MTNSHLLSLTYSVDMQQKPCSVSAVVTVVTAFISCFHCTILYFKYCSILLILHIVTTFYHDLFRQCNVHNCNCRHANVCITMRQKNVPLYFEQELSISWWMFTLLVPVETGRNAVQ